MKVYISNWTSVCCVCVEVRGWPPKSSHLLLLRQGLARCCLPHWLASKLWDASLCLPSHRRNIGITDRPFHAWRCMGPGIQFQASYCKAGTCCTELHSHPLSSHFKIQKLSKTGLFSVFTQTVHNRRGLKPANWLATFFLWVVIWRT